MAKRIKKRKFSNNQLVVFRFGDRKIVGNVVFVKPVGKQFIYDVAAEDGKTYYELTVDGPVNNSIDTYLTKLFYQKYKIDESAIPEIEDDTPLINSKKLVETIIETPEEIEEDEEYELDEEDSLLFTEEDADPNY
jgi:hypothetical protein